MAIFSQTSKTSPKIILNHSSNKYDFSHLKRIILSKQPVTHVIRSYYFNDLDHGAVFQDAETNLLFMFWLKGFFSFECKLVERSSKPNAFMQKSAPRNTGKQRVKHSNKSKPLMEKSISCNNQKITWPRFLPYINLFQN